MLTTPKKPRRAELNEGPQAFANFREAVKRVLSVSKSDLPPDPFKKSRIKKKKANQH
jgi:hypothetical protein